MKVSCEIIRDLLPLVKDNVASEESINLVSEHLKNCESCKLEFGHEALPIQKEVDDKRVLVSIKKKLFLISSVLLFFGAFIGMAINKNTSSNFMPIVVVLLSTVFVGIMIFKFKWKGDKRVSRFFVGKAIGTMIVFAILGIYLLLKYLLQF
ncbi:zf-HC2 domain-containing protein [Desulfosporosinus hippei]|uniref:Putative zinc-finger n=1 Tax=Desulfosporosinus hippei DSM 8344 TaxID=1121419 RepID=A0A1G7VEZ8_9FIRM|nr:zf-HC2 domain-containing protein [Desulfosporosinus hippei]SDG58313.1 Putative zinc-finger [Desulfosporosinus hippei DSM 8344]